MSDLVRLRGKKLYTLCNVFWLLFFYCSTYSCHRAGWSNLWEAGKRLPRKWRMRKWRGNGERMRNGEEMESERENGGRMRKWREGEKWRERDFLPLHVFSFPPLRLHFLILSPCSLSPSPHFVSISSQFSHYLAFSLLITLR